MATLSTPVGVLRAQSPAGQDSPPRPLQMVPDETKELQGFCWAEGLITYGFKVRGKGSLRVELHHPNQTFIHLRMTSKWNRMEGGMLGNKLHKAWERVVTYRNPSDQPQTVYIVVYDRSHFADKERPFMLEIKRDEDTRPGAPDK